ncbi:hypothetical protein [Nesterenkonia pannonica]|uniref:hypothetical protein n=1 Tax=Nesterenkonia pannonica TaxID=1548602 RepID=UPI0021645C18|nr:hypothetical protein [Nesterenkonia pannonica]
MSEPTQTLYIPKLYEWMNANQMRKWHWSKRSKLNRLWRHDAHRIARSEQLRPLQRAHILIEVHKTTNARYDPGNLHPTAKAIVDGLIDYGLLPDDDALHLDGPDIRPGEKECRPGFTITITPLEAT